MVPLIACFAGSLIISNLVLRTGAVRGKLEEKLKTRSGASWKIGSLSWTPWTGVQVRNVTVKAPSAGSGLPDRPLCRTELDVKLYWGSLLRGALDLKEVRVRSGKIAIPMELLFLLRDTVNQSRVLSPEPPLVPSPQVERQGGNPETPKKRLKPKPPSRHETASLAAASSFRLIIDQCDLMLYSNGADENPVFRLRNVSGELPLSGKESSGVIRCEGVAIGSRLFKLNWASRVEWQHPSLNLPPVKVVWNGFTIRSEGVLQMMRRPRFAVRIDIPAGELPSDVLALPPGSGVKIGAKRLRLRGALSGSLTLPSSWKGDLSVNAMSVSVGHDQTKQGILFNEGRMMAVVRGGRFNLLDARLQSERLSLLGNGVLLPDGQLGAVMRVVADQDYASTLTRFAMGAAWTGGWTRSWLKPMETPDRYYRDIVLEGTVNQAKINVGRKGEQMNLEQAWSQMLAFLKKESRETEERMTARPVEQNFSNESDRR